MKGTEIVRGLQSAAMSAPRRGNRLTRATSRGLLRLAGWRLEGEVPDLPKFVAIGAPHTTNWDFVLGMAAIWGWGLRVDWIGKHTLFRFPWGGALRWMGGHPVERDAGGGHTARLVALLATRKACIVALAPEGTRRMVTRWRTGFWHVAHGAHVPICACYIDYARKVIGLGRVFETTGDLEADLARIREFYRDKTARFPERTS